MPFIDPPNGRSQSNDLETKAVVKESQDAASITTLEPGAEEGRQQLIDNEDDTVDWDIVGREEVEQDRAWFQYGQQRDARSREQGKTYRGHYHIDVGWGRWKVRIYEVNWAISGDYPRGCGGCSTHGNVRGRGEDADEDQEDDGGREDDDADEVSHEHEHEDRPEDEPEGDEEMEQHK